MPAYYAILFPVMLLAAMAMVAYHSRRQKAQGNEYPLVGSTAFVKHQLVPEGTVLVHGELWSARSLHGQWLPSETSVTVVGLRGHMLLVEDLQN
jgi:membrane-bound serine protease (ClpP class)